MNLGQGRRLRAHSNAILTHLLNIEGALLKYGTNSPSIKGVLLKQGALIGVEKDKRAEEILKSVNDLKIPWQVRLDSRNAARDKAIESVIYANLNHLVISTQDTIRALAKVKIDEKSEKNDNDIDERYEVISDQFEDIARIAWILERRKRRQWPRSSRITIGADILTVRVLAALALLPRGYQATSGTNNVFLDELRFGKSLRLSRDEQIEIARNELEKIINERSERSPVEEITLQFEIPESDIPYLRRANLNIRFGTATITTYYSSALQWINTKSVALIQKIPEAVITDARGKPIHALVNHPLTDGTGANITKIERLVGPRGGMTLKLDWDEEHNLIPLRIKVKDHGRDHS